MEDAPITAGELVLSPVWTAWGGQLVRELVAVVKADRRPVVVLGNDAQARLLQPEEVLGSDPHQLLDLLPEPEFVAVVHSDQAALRLPRSRPLVVVQGDKVLGLIGDETRPEIRAVVPETEVVQADAVVKATLQGHLEDFRQAGVPVALDIRTAQTRGGTAVLREMLDTLLTEVLSRAKERGGDSTAHVVLAPGRSGTWLVVEDRAGRLPALVRQALTSEDVRCEDPLVRSFRRLKELVEELGGSMKAQPNPWGARLMACLPSPQGIRAQAASEDDEAAPPKRAQGLKVAS